MAQDLNLGMKCIKYMLFVSNAMFVMVGILLMSFGSTIKSLYYNFEVFMEDHYFSPATLTVAIGAIILLIAAFGCIAALKESTCLVNVYALLLSLVLILELSASIAAYAMRADIEYNVKTQMTNAMRDYSRDNSTRDAVDNLQTWGHCCGVESYVEWYNYNRTTMPESCCYERHESCDPYEDGCLYHLVRLIEDTTIMLGTGALCITVVQVLGIVFALMLAKSIRRIKSQRAALQWHSRQELYLQLARGNDKAPPTPVPVTYTSQNNSAEGETANP